MAYASRQPAPAEHAVEVTRNAKGAMQFTVTVRGTDLLACESDAAAVVGRLEALWPYPSNGGDG